MHGIINQSQKKNEILPFVTAQMDLENIKRKNWTDVNTILFHLYLQSKK